MFLRYIREVSNEIYPLSSRLKLQHYYFNKLVHSSQPPFLFFPPPSLNAFAYIRLQATTNRLADRKQKSTRNKLCTEMRYLSNPYPDYSEARDKECFSFHSEEQVQVLCQTLLDRIGDNVDSVIPDAKGYLYIGPGGVAYALWYATRGGSLTFQKQTAKLLMEEQLKLEKIYCPDTISSRLSGWLCGFSGVYAAAAVMAIDADLGKDSDNYLKQFKALTTAILHSGAGGTKLSIDCFENILKIVFFTGCEEFMNGRAGFVLGSLFLRKNFRDRDEQVLVPIQDLHTICNKMVQVGRAYSSSTTSPCPLMYSWYDSEYLGAAHGLSAILLAFLCVPGYLEQSSSSVQKDIKGSIEYLLSLQTKSGNFPCLSPRHERPRAEEDELVHWCHGAPGFIFLLAKGKLLRLDFHFYDKV